jgi:hypothetical protein
MSNADQLKKSLIALNLSFQSDLKREAMHSFSQLSKIHKKITDEFTYILKPKDDLAYKAARSYLEGSLDGFVGEYEIISFALSNPIKELGGVSVASSKDKLIKLLDRYRSEFAADEIDGIFWFGVFQSYFQAQKQNFHSDSFQFYQRATRKFLLETWPFVVRNSTYQTSWMKSIEKNKHLLTDNPAEIYGAEWLNGSDVRIKEIKTELQIPDSSWFWEDFFRSCLKASLTQNDLKFKEFIPQTIELLKRHPSFLDVGLSALLDRYRAGNDLKVHIALKEFSLWAWKNPKLRNVGASKWIHAAEPTWRMVLAWVQEANLRLFFELLRRRGVPDPHGRLDFWMQYINQITFTRLVLGYEMRMYLNRNPDLREHFKNDVESYAHLTGEKAENGLDAFIMEINGHYIVEFNPHGGCYVYKKGANNFDVNASSLQPTTNKGGLKERYYTRGTLGPDLVHRDGWQYKAKSSLLPQFGIFDDVRAGKATTKNTVFSIDKYFK